jgi:hypothetical protein
MATDEQTIAQPNLTPLLSKIGRIIKKSNDGKTAQKILTDKLIIFWISLVSLYNQIRPRMDTKGKEAAIAAAAVKRFPNSDTPKMIKADIIIFRKYCITLKDFIGWSVSDRVYFIA